MIKRISILLSSLLLLCACGGDNITPEDQIPTGFDFNLVTIENVSEPTEEGQRTIVLNFKDKEGNALKLTALSWYCHLETGKYEIAPEPDSKHKASVELSLGNEKLNVKGGSIAVSKWNYEYDIKFTIETDKGKFTGIADNKKLYFETQQYSSLKTGANEIYQKDLTVKSDLMNTSVKYSIYLPESYDGTKKYPVLYMLHGYGGNNNDWLQDNTGSIWAGGGTMPAYAREYAKKTGKELFNGRISRNHKKDSENLHPYRGEKVSAGKRTIRKQRYPIQPHDVVIYDGRKYEISGCHNNGTRAILLPSRKSVSVKKLKIHHFSGGYFVKQRIAQ